MIKAIILYFGLIFILLVILLLISIVNFNITVYGTLENRILAKTIEKRIEGFGVQARREKRKITVALNKIIGDMKWDRMYVVRHFQPKEGRFFIKLNRTIGIQWRGESEWNGWIYIRDTKSWSLFIIKDKNVIPIKINRYLVDVGKGNKAVYCPKEKINLTFYYTTIPFERVYVQFVNL